jgi:hypothetical protein
MPLDFLAAVLPSSGIYCVAELNSPKKEHIYRQSLEELEHDIDQLIADGRDTYFALSTFKEAGSRKAENAHAIRALFIDVDAIGEGKKYPKRADAAAALDAFLTTTGMAALGQPWIVSSGNGLHAYWPFAAETDIVSWKPVAENFKRLCKHHELAIDMTVTADEARVLRVPGTFNHKSTPPKPVKLVVRGSTFDFDAVAKVIRDGVPSQLAFSPAPTFALGPKPAFIGASPTSVKIVENSASRFKTIWQRSKNGGGCRQLGFYRENATGDGIEPLWRGWLSIAKACEDGVAAGELLTNMHPYPMERMRQKWEEIKGPYPCSKFDSENPGVCSQCPHFGKITNPLALGRELKADNAPKVVEVPQLGAPGLPPKKVLRPSPPRGYSFGEKGGVYAVAKEEAPDGESYNRNILLLPYDLFVVDLLSTNGEHTIHLVADRPGMVQNITIPQKSVIAKDDALKALAAHNVVAIQGAANDKYLYGYIRACVEELSAGRCAVAVPSQFGWQPGNSFVFAGNIYFPDGTVREVPMPGLENLTNNTQPTGTLDGWKKLWNVLIARQMWDIIAMACIGFGAPLMRFTGLYGITFHAGSTESGTGKSLTLSAIASIWGHPTHYRLGKSTSPVAMQQRAGLLNSLPVVSDEITAKNRNDFEWFPQYVFDFSEGRGKERMESGANKERINLSTWASITYMSSNTHMLDYMTGARKHASEGELRRFLEWTPTSVLRWSEQEKDVIRSLNDNYGVAGMMYAKWLATHRAEAEIVVQRVTVKLTKEFDCSDDERYWVAGCAAIVAGAILASSKYAGIIDLPIEKIVASLKEIVLRARHAVRSNVRTADDVLNSYTREYYGNFVMVKYNPALKHIEASFGNGTIIDRSSTRGQVLGRIEHNATDGYVDYFIEETLVKRYCSTMSFGYSDFKQKMSSKHRISVERKDMMADTPGPRMRVTALRISQRTEDTEIDFVGVT